MKKKKFRIYFYEVGITLISKADTHYTRKETTDQSYEFWI